MFKVIRQGERPNNFWIAPIESKGLSRQVNQRQLFDMGTSKEGLAEREEEEEVEDEDLGPAIPHYNPKVKLVLPIGPSHKYNLCPRPVPLPWKRKGGVAMATSKLVTHL